MRWCTPHGGHQVAFCMYARCCRCPTAALTVRFWYASLRRLLALRTLPEVSSDVATAAFPIASRRPHFTRYSLQLSHLVICVDSPRAPPRPQCLPSFLPRRQQLGGRPGAPRVRGMRCSEQLPIETSSRLMRTPIFFCARGAHIKTLLIIKHVAGRSRARQL